MEKNIKKVCIILMVWISCIGVAYPKTMTINELINQSKVMDGQQVTLEAEVIGDIMKRGEYTWFNINDGSAAIGVYIDTKATEAINRAGNYKQKGDTVKVSGIFHRAYNAEGGDLAIEGRNLELVQEGKITHNNLPVEKIKLLIAMIVITTCILTTKYFKLHSKKVNTK